VSITAPDIAGFVAADQQLRQNFGTPITFEVPQAPVWPAGTQINPDTGQPFSAMVKPTNAPYLEVVINALIILKEASPLRPQADTTSAPAGFLSGMDIILDIDAADYPSVQEATQFVYATRTYEVREFKPFQMASSLYRYLVYGQEH
jgi:hypothetical protein